MSPQKKRFNQQVWRILESKVNTWAIESGHGNVITGAIFDWEVTASETLTQTPRGIYRPNSLNFPEIGKRSKIKTPARGQAGVFIL